MAESTLAVSPGWMGQRVAAEQPRVLVIDDEPIVRSVMQGMLEILGCRISVCSSGLDAITLLQEAGSEIDYIFCDLNMGGLQGSALFRRIFDISPCIQLIVMSGRIDSDEIEGFRREGVSGFLSKPFSIEALRNELGRISAA